jgi:hypothetical protein
LLQRIGFDWGEKYGDSRWMKWYEEFKKYRQKEGHGNHPTKGSKLARWVVEQRKQYKRFHEGKESKMTQEHIHLLEKVDFVWEASKPGSGRESDHRSGALVHAALERSDLIGSQSDHHSGALDHAALVHSNSAHQEEESEEDEEEETAGGEGVQDDRTKKRRHSQI